MIHYLLKPSSIVGILALLISSIILFDIKYKVQNTRKELNKVEAEIIQNKEDIHILKAELSYITKPEILAKLSQKHLNLVPVDPKKVKSLKQEEMHKLFLRGGE